MGGRSSSPLPPPLPPPPPITRTQLNTTLQSALRERCRIPNDLLSIILGYACEQRILLISQLVKPAQSTIEKIVCGTTLSTFSENGGHPHTTHLLQTHRITAFDACRIDRFFSLTDGRAIVLSKHSPTLYVFDQTISSTVAPKGVAALGSELSVGWTETRLPINLFRWFPDLMGCAVAPALSALLLVLNYDGPGLAGHALCVIPIPSSASPSPPHYNATPTLNEQFRYYPLPSQNESCRLIVINDYDVYVTGGVARGSKTPDNKCFRITLPTVSPPASTEAQRLVRTVKWQSVATMNTERAEHFIAGSGQRIVVGSGAVAARHAIETTECYDTKTDCWNVINDNIHTGRKHEFMWRDLLMIDDRLFAFCRSSETDEPDPPLIWTDFLLPFDWTTKQWLHSELIRIQLPGLNFDESDSYRTMFVAVCPQS